nr:hypothetical protein [uncultured Blautia sp.]
MGLQLFDRSHRGLQVTPAGASMYKDAKYVIQYCKESVARAEQSGKSGTEYRCDCRNLR